MASILFNVGYSNFLNAERVVAVVNPNSVPARRLRDEAREQGLLVDATTGRRVRSIVVTSSRHVVVSSLEVVTLAARYNEACQEFLRQTGRFPAPMAAGAAGAEDAVLPPAGLPETGPEPEDGPEDASPLSPAPADPEDAPLKKPRPRKPRGARG
jgi:regulator of extracellular matrix RemA (YlzA/DUF370 family)